MRTLLELMVERDRCERELKRPEVIRDDFARVFLIGAKAFADWMAGKNASGTPAPSNLTAPLAKGPPDG